MPEGYEGSRYEFLIRGNRVGITASKYSLLKPRLV